MTANEQPPAGQAHAGLARRIGRRRSFRITAGVTAAVVTAAMIASTGGGAAAAATLPQAQSVGNFVDADLGGQPIDQLLKLQYAHAMAPGTNGVQNPLNVTALNAINLPLTGALQLPKLLGINLGAVNQVAKANVNGASYGASGAVSNSGGVSVGGNNNAFPADASVDLCASAIAGGKCGSGAGDDLAEVKLSTGAVSGVASTPVGYGKPGATKYEIAGLNLELTAPALGKLLGQVTTTLSGALATILGPKGLGPILGQLGLLPKSCTLTSGKLPTTISLADGGVTVDLSTLTITVDLGKILAAAKVPLNGQPPNTDLIKAIIDNLSTILSNGLGGIVTGLIDTLEKAVGSCVTALTKKALGTLLDDLKATVKTVTTDLGKVVKPITDALGPLLNDLKGLIDIGVNVQPNGPAGTYKSPLDATPKQGTPVVAGQTIVRAIEIDVLGKSLLAVALGNAAAGPSNAPAAPPTSTPPTTTAPPTAVPTGVPAGLGNKSATPVLPLTLLLLGLLFAGGGAVALRVRVRANRH